MYSALSPTEIFSTHTIWYYSIDIYHSRQMPTDTCRCLKVPTDPYRSLQIPTDPCRSLPSLSGIYSQPPSPIFLCLGQHSSASSCRARGPCSNLRSEHGTGRDGVKIVIWSSLLGSFPVGAPGPPDRCEYWFSALYQIYLTLSACAGDEMRMKES